MVRYLFYTIGDLLINHPSYLTSLLLSIPVLDGGCMKATETVSTFYTLEGTVSHNTGNVRIA